MKKLLLIITMFIAFLSFNNTAYAIDEYPNDIDNLIVNINLEEDDTYYYLDYQFKVVNDIKDNTIIMNKYGTELMDYSGDYTQTEDSYVFKVEKGKEYSVYYRVRYSQSSYITLPELLTVEGYRLRYIDYKIYVADKNEKIYYNASDHDYRIENTYNGEIEDLSDHKIYLIVNQPVDINEQLKSSNFFNIFNDFKYQVCICIYSLVLVLIHFIFRKICENNDFNHFKFYFILMIVTNITIPFLIMPISVIIIGIFYIPFFILAFFTPDDKNSVFLKLFVAFHSLMLAGCFLNPVAYIIAIYLANELGKFYQKYKGLK